MPHTQRRTKRDVSAGPWKAQLTLWVRGNELQPGPTRMVRVTTDDISADGFTFRHLESLEPGTTVLAYVAAFPDAPLLETQVCECVADSAEGTFRVSVAVKGRCNRIPPLAGGLPDVIQPA
jgi:hypothetical protein